MLRASAFSPAPESRSTTERRKTEFWLSFMGISKISGFFAKERLHS